jgi:hypothetical protein
VTAQGHDGELFTTEGEPAEGGAPSVQRAPAPRWFSPGKGNISEGQKLT